MSEVYFRKNGTTYHLDSRNGYPCEAKLVYRIPYSSASITVPAMSTQGTKVYAGLNSSGLQVYYDTSSPTIAFRKGGKTYYCSKVLTTVVPADIPAGTYTPSAFDDLISSFISQNGSRAVKNSFSVVVNGQTYSVPAGRAICYTYQYGGEARFVCFNGSQRGWESFDSFSKGIYCTYWRYSHNQGDGYYRYNIKVNTSFNFK